MQEMSSDLNSAVDIKESSGAPVLRSRPVNSNVSSVAATLQALKPDKMPTLPSQTRPRVGSTARRTALGWSKRSAKSSTEQKENNVGKENVAGVGTTLS